MIGVFGGTFDPIHIGHLRSVIDLRQRLSLQRVHMMPCHQPPHRPQPVASAAQRMAMLQLALQHEPGLIADRRELDRDGPSYTVLSLQELRQHYPDQALLLIMGSDAFASFEQWHQWQQILQLAHLVVVQRPDAVINVASNSPLRQHLIDDPADYQQQASGAIWHCRLPQWPLAATEIRAAIAAGHSIRYLVPQPVQDYIQQHRLYHHKG